MYLKKFIVPKEHYTQFGILPKYSIISTTFLSIGRVTASGVSSFTGSQRNDWPDAVGYFFYEGIAEEWSFLKPKPVAHRRNDGEKALLFQDGFFRAFDDVSFLVV